MQFDSIFQNDLIIAPITSLSNLSAVAIIRISGFFNPNDFNVLIKFSGPIEPRHQKLVHIVDPDSSLVIDQALLTYFPNPYSFTGEDVLELACHGNPLIVETVINLMQKFFSMRIASPGEFTLRAFKNNKLSLNQVEGLDAILHASSVPMLLQSQKSFSAKFNTSFEKLLGALKKHKMLIDILIDFSDDVSASIYSDFSQSLQECEAAISELYEKVSIPLNILVKPEIVLFGLPNAGKSTLFNNLLGHNRSLVSTIPGTTRDYVSENFSIEGTSFILIDTAGLRDSEDVLEQSGILLAQDKINAAFIRIFVINLSTYDDVLLSQLLTFNPQYIVFTHLDLISSQDLMNLKDKLHSKYKGFELFFSERNDHDFIRNFKLNILERHRTLFRDDPILVARQRSVIQKIRIKFSDYKFEFDHHRDLAILSEFFKMILLEAESLVGVLSVDEVLNEIFSNFCIGK